MTVAVRTVSGPLEDDQRQQAIFAGTLLIFKHVEAMGALCSYVDELLRRTLVSENPVRAQFEMNRRDYLDRVAAAQKEFRASPHTTTLLRRVLEEAGVDSGSSYWDRPYLRVSPDDDGHDDRRTQKLGAHRDTWASNIYSQTNWWAPIYPITDGRAIAFYPQYWTQRLENTSATWDLEEVMSGKISVITPEAEEPVDTSSELRVVLEPGDLLAFSGAHLHASVPNTTGLARFSIEVRTADVGCEIAGRGAPNLDGDAPHVATRWFRRVADKQPLTTAMARPGRPG